MARVTVHHRPQTKVFPQGLAFVLGPEQPAPPQFGNHRLDKILASAGQRGPACTITGWPCGIPVTFKGPRTRKNVPW